MKLEEACVFARVGVSCMTWLGAFVREVDELANVFRYSLQYIRYPLFLVRNVLFFFLTRTTSPGYVLILKPRLTLIILNPDWLGHGWPKTGSIWIKEEENILLNSTRVLLQSKVDYEKYFLWISLPLQLLTQKSGFYSKAKKALAQMKYKPVESTAEACLKRKQAKSDNLAAEWFSSFWKNTPYFTYFRIAIWAFLLH